jgi:hypothetical protein
MVGNAILIIILGFLFKAILLFLTNSWKKFTWRERLAISLIWSPKSAIQAALGGLMLLKFQ